VNWTQEQVDAHLLTVGLAAPLPPATGRIPKPEMNKTETAYAEHLRLQYAVGAVLWYGFEVITIKLGPDCRYTPDFLVMYKDGHLEAHDTKGAKKIKLGLRAGQTEPYIHEDALVKAKVMAAHFVVPLYFVWPEANGGWGKRGFE